MKSRLLFALAAGIVAVSLAPGQARAQQPWHGGYYNPNYGAPVALVVPPTARRETHYSWGWPASHSQPISGRFRRYGYAGNSYGQMSPTPYNPSHTEQFGIYPVRAPWRP